MSVADDRKRSHLQTDLYEINGKRILVQRIPGISDFWSDATPGQQFWMVIIIVVITLMYSVMDHFDLKFGSPASDIQMNLGTMAPAAKQTGPDFNYWSESWDIVRTEVARNDPRVRKEDVQQMTTPERYPTWYGKVNDKRWGYISHSRFKWFFNYLVKVDVGKYESIYGYGIVRLEQKQVGIFVRQEWVLDRFIITYRE